LVLLIAVAVIVIATAVIISKRRGRKAAVRPQVTVTCPKCGFANKQEDSFCANCGSSLKQKRQAGFLAHQTPQYGEVIGQAFSERH